ncbi:hypothetical protein AAVH_31010, partial [Aphelenchoides avenae]
MKVYEMYFPRTYSTKVVSVFIGVVTLVTATVGLTANMLVIIAVLGDRKMRRSPTNLLLANL